MAKTETGFSIDEQEELDALEEFAAHITEQGSQRLAELREKRGPEDYIIAV